MQMVMLRKGVPGTAGKEGLLRRPAEKLALDLEGGEVGQGTEMGGSHFRQTGQLRQGT